VRKQRPLTKYFSISAHALRPFDLRTTVDFADEIFSGVRIYADVPEAGRELLRSKGIGNADIDGAFSAMQSFIRQSQSFYSAARNAGPRSSSLNYYYSFLNLAKTLLCLQAPKLVEGRIHHGLSHRLSHEPLDKQVITVQDGVFPLLYKSIIGTEIPLGTTFNVLDLLAYCSDISYEVETSRSVEHAMIRGSSRGLAHMPSKEAFAMLAFLQFARFEKCESAKVRFFETFDEVDVTVDFADRVFGVKESFKRQVRFFEQKGVSKFEGDTVPLVDLEKVCIEALAPYALEEPYIDDEGFEFYLSRPLMIGAGIPFNQILATYAVFFVLSNIVRYYPVYFEKQFGHRDVWIIESFARSTPITLLRHLANRLAGQNRRLTSR
jgi:hypothetical protein